MVDRRHIPRRLLKWADRKNGYLYTDESFLYRWQQNKDQINPTYPKDQNENKREREVFPPSTTYNSWYWRKGRFQVRGGYGMVETASIWFPAAPTAGDYGGCWLPSFIAHWCECGFVCYISPSFWKTRGKREVLHFPLFLTALNTNTPSALHCMWVPSGAWYFFTVFSFSSKQEITTEWPQLPLQDANELMSVSRQL